MDPSIHQRGEPIPSSLEVGFACLESISTSSGSSALLESDLAAAGSSGFGPSNSVFLHKCCWFLVFVGTLNVFPVQAVGE